MSVFVTGGTGFIGRHLLPLLLQRGETVHVLVRESSRERFDALRSRIGPGSDRLLPVVGDLLAPRLGLDSAALEALRGDVDHFYHLAALYDMDAGAFLLGTVIMTTSGVLCDGNTLSINQEGTALFVNAGEGVNVDFIPVTVANVPEPSTLVLVAFGLIAMLGYGLKR